ncbi:hypothetical protein G6F24_017280 [Rhizopus arrhizus]|nr:hypothetical protein G6F24_017280 [Rhizopus arrhizus]
MSRHCFCDGVQSPECLGNIGVDRPMSLENAAALCRSTVGCPAFRLKRPSTRAPVRASLTQLALPTMPSRLSAPTLARMSASWMDSSNPSPSMGGARRGEICVAARIGP